MKIRKALQMMKSLSDDTRLRIINLLKEEELSVTEICDILDVQQSNLSKHLSRLRLTGLVDDKREGFNVYYSLVKPKDKVLKKLLNVLTVGLAENEILQTDQEKMKEILAKTRIEEQ
ncbi:MAG: metalloregulator ArsR/SmtB family transcription factor [Candidatus Omnitrophota bacterium]